MGNSKIVNMFAFSISWSFELHEPLKNLLMLLPSLFLFIFLCPDYIDCTFIVRIYHVFVRGSTVATRMNESVPQKSNIVKMMLIKIQ